jgi:hypothetical protein
MHRCQQAAHKLQTLPTSEAGSPCSAHVVSQLLVQQFRTKECTHAVPRAFTLSVYALYPPTPWMHKIPPSPCNAATPPVCGSQTTCAVSSASHRTAGATRNTQAWYPRAAARVHTRTQGHHPTPRPDTLTNEAPAVLHNLHSARLASQALSPSLITSGWTNTTSHAGGFKGQGECPARMCVHRGRFPTLHSCSPYASCACHDTHTTAQRCTRVNVIVCVSTGEACTCIACRTPPHVSK